MSKGGDFRAILSLIVGLLGYIGGPAVLSSEVSAQPAASTVVPSSSSNSPAKIARDLSIVRSKLERENRRLNSLQTEEKQLLDSLDLLTSEANRLEVSERETKETLDSLVKEVAVRELQTAQAERDLKAEQSRFERRLVALYKVQHRNEQLLYLAEAHSLGELLRRSRYISAIAQEDRLKVTSLDELHHRLTQEKSLLAQKQQERADALAEIVRLSKEVGKKREEKARLLRECERKKALQEQSLASLERSAAELERVLAAIMGSSSEERETSAAVVTAIPKPEPTTGVRDSKQIATPFKGPGLASLAGKLPAPVAGTVLTRFGKQRHEEFSDILFVKGLEFASTVGARVTPVAKGKVILSQYLPGFGNVVIVDHGSRYYTLYGRLASVLAMSGDIVSPTDVVGILGEPDFRGRSFYFELRHKGKAIDPQRYLAAEVFATVKR